MRSIWAASTVGVFLIVACAGGGADEAEADRGLAAAEQAPAAGSVEAKIQEAESAAPGTIAAQATIMDWPEAEGGEPTVLREGSNDWACFPTPPDKAAKGGHEPMCLDSEFQKWGMAWMSRATPELSGVGIGYMLAGDAGASNIDPFATESTPDNEWVVAPPHLMLVVPDPATLDPLPTDPDNGGPWVMWKGTPYAHVMMPVEK